MYVTFAFDIFGNKVKHCNKLQNCQKIIGFFKDIFIHSCMHVRVKETRLKRLLLHFAAFFHVALLLSTGVDNEKMGVDNEKVGVDNEKALELDNSIFFHILA